MLAEVLNAFEPQELAGLLLRFEKLCGFLRGGGVGNPLRSLVASVGAFCPRKSICPIVDSALFVCQCLPCFAKVTAVCIPELKSLAVLTCFRSWHVQSIVLASRSLARTWKE